MSRIRIIPVLLLKGKGLVKGVKFENHQYIGDPLNAVKIFNEKEVDELVFLDITATNENRKISTEIVKRIADECYMPFAVGGGLKTIEDVMDILNSGAEKVVINSTALSNPGLIKNISSYFGSQSVIVSIDVSKGLLGYNIYSNSGTKKCNMDLFEYIKIVQDCGAGEIMITSIDLDGTFSGYDYNLLKLVCDRSNIPVIASGGAGRYEDFRDVLRIQNISAAAAGGLFVFWGNKKGVLINYPSKKELLKIFI